MLIIKEEKENLENIQKTQVKEHFEISKTINLIENKKRDLEALKEHFEKVTQKGVKNKVELAKLEIYTYDYEPPMQQVLRRLNYIDSVLHEITQRLERIASEMPKKKEKKEPSTDLEPFLTIYNDVFKSKRKGNAKVARQLNARIKEGYALEDMRSAMVEAKKEQRHIENNFKWLTPEFFTRPDKLDLYTKSEVKKEQRKFTTYDDLCKKEN